MYKLLIICGPTATGKTRLGIELAKKFNGEIVSADSKQVYRGMDVGTGKDLPVSSKLQLSAQSFQLGYYEIKRVKVWLLDIVEPDYKFNVADYKKCADAIVEDIWKRKKLPIVVGGTGFYIKAIVDGIETMGVLPDWKLREELSHCSIDSLLDCLRKLDPKKLERMNESDRRNPRRLIRAIEVAKWKCEVRNGKLDTEMRSGNKKSHLSPQYPASHFQLPTSILFVGLTVSNEILYQRIDQRVDERVRGGIEEEIRGLLVKGYNWENSALGTTLAYQEWQGYFEGEETEEEVIKKWKFDEHDYARRQKTWFKKNQKINWYDILKKSYTKEIEKLVESWYS